MAIAFDASSSGVSGGSGITIAHTCASGAVLFFGMHLVGTSIQSGPSYDGVAMTLVDVQAEGEGYAYYLYFLANPNAGTHNIVVNFNDGSSFTAAAAVSYTGAYASGQPENKSHNGSASNVTAWSLAVTTLSDNAWAIMMVAGKTGVVSAGTATTKRVGSNPDGDSYRVTFLDSNGAVTPAGSRTLAETQSSSPVGAIAVSLGSQAVSAIKTVDGLATSSVKTVDGLALGSIKNINGLA